MTTEELRALLRIQAERHDHERLMGALTAATVVVNAVGHRESWQERTNQEQAAYDAALDLITACCTTSVRVPRRGMDVLEEEGGDDCFD